MKPDFKLIDKQIDNLEEEVLGVSVENIKKMLYWLEDNRMLSGEGRTFSTCFAKRVRK